MRFSKINEKINSRQSLKEETTTSMMVYNVSDILKCCNFHHPRWGTIWPRSGKRGDIHESHRRRRRSPDQDLSIVNHRSEFDWNELYGKGVYVVNFKTIDYMQCKDGSTSVSTLINYVGSIGGFLTKPIC
jgi:hypothetical protein